MIDPRDRITDRVSRARLKVEARRATLPLLVFLVGVAVGLGAWFVIVKNVGRQAYTATQRVSFRVADATGVVAGRQEVRFKGIPAGTISGVARVDGASTVTVKLFRSFGPIYRDARAALRPNTALVDMFLDITNRGTPAAGRASTAAPVPVTRTAVGVQADEVLQAFSPDVRAHLRTLLYTLGGGLDRRGNAVRSIFVEAVPFLVKAQQLSTQVARRSTLTKDLVHNLALLTGELGRRDTSLRALVRNGDATLSTLEASSPALSATLHELPTVLATLDSSFTAVRGALPALDGGLTRLDPVAQRLPAGLGAVRRLSAAARPAVLALRPPVAQLVPLALELRPFAQDLAASVTTLRPQVPALDHVTHTVAICPTALQGFFQWTPSVLKMEDGHGTTFRGEFDFGADSTAAVKEPNVIAPKSCSDGSPVGGEAGPGGDLQPSSGAAK